MTVFAPNIHDLPRVEDAQVVSGTNGHQMTDADAVHEHGGPPVLPEGFWSSRPALDHVRTAARSRLIAPDALLGAVLARVCLHTDSRFVLPAAVGRLGSLNVAVGIVGQSGAGKGSVTDESAALAGHLDQGPEHVVTEAPAGSGEGIVRCFFNLARDPDDKRRTVLVRARHGVLIRVDEGEALQKLGARQGQTTWQVLRQAFSGEALGGSYVDETRRSRLDAHSYRLALLVAIQPELARFLLDDVIGGTPQRFLWVAAHDPDAPSIDLLPEHPGALPWRPPAWSDQVVQGLLDVAPDGYRRAVLDVHGEIVMELQQHRRDVLAGLHQDPLDSHHGLVRLKVAALLAVLDGRVDVNLDDWALAGTITDTSRDVRTWTQGRISAEGNRRDEAFTARAADRAGKVETAKLGAVAEVARVAAVVARHVHKHTVGTEVCSRRCVTQAIRSNDRHEMSAAVGHALNVGWIVEDEGGYQPGPSRPSS